MHGEILDVDRIHACMRWTLADHVQHALDLVRRAFHDGLHSAVTEIAHRAVKTASVAFDKGPKADHLHAPAHHGARAHRRCLHASSIGSDVKRRG